jgi:hypothetical protein
MFGVAFAFDSPFKSFGDGLFRISIACPVFFYPVCFIIGAVLNFLKRDKAKQKAKFWLGLPWKIIGCYFVAVLIACFLRK